MHFAFDLRHRLFKQAKICQRCMNMALPNPPASRPSRYSIDRIGHDEQGDYVVAIVGHRELQISAGRVWYRKSDGQKATIDHLFARSRNMHAQGAAGIGADPLLQARLDIIPCQLPSAARTRSPPMTSIG